MKNAKQLTILYDEEVKKKTKNKKGFGSEFCPENELMKRLKQCIAYIRDFNPTEEQVTKQKDLVAKDLDIIEDRREDWLILHESSLGGKQIPLNKRDTYYRKLHDVPKKKQQLKMLNLILS